MNGDRDQEGAVVRRGRQAFTPTGSLEAALNSSPSIRPAELCAERLLGGSPVLVAVREPRALVPSVHGETVM